MPLKYASARTTRLYADGERLLLRQTEPNTSLGLHDQSAELKGGK